MGAFSEEVKTFMIAYRGDCVYGAPLHFPAQQRCEEDWAAGGFLLLKEFTLREFSFIES